jgi:hypothetical protein
MNNIIKIFRNKIMRLKGNNVTIYSIIPYRMIIKSFIFAVVGVS